MTTFELTVQDRWARLSYAEKRRVFLAVQAEIGDALIQGPAMNSLDWRAFMRNALDRKLKELGK